MAAFVARAHDVEPADLADVLASLDEEERVAVVRSLPPELSSQALAEMPVEEHAEDTLAALAPEQALSLPQTSLTRLHRGDPKKLDSQGQARRLDPPPTPDPPRASRETATKDRFPCFYLVSSDVILCPLKNASEFHCLRQLIPLKVSGPQISA